jgi:Holliday junction DNA helicase RuvB
LVIDGNLAAMVLDKLGLDALGLNSLDRLVLKTLKTHFSGGPVGIQSLAAALHLDRKTIEDMHEPYLVHHHLILRTPRGRLLTDKGLRHLESFENF